MKSVMFCVRIVNDVGLGGCLELQVWISEYVGMRECQYYFEKRISRLLC